MKTSMNLYFKTTLDTKVKFDAIKAAGFNEFFTGMYDQKETLKFKEQIDYANQIGLKCTMVHCCYYEPKLNSFWLDGQSGDEVMNDYIDQINKCGKYTKNFVVHLNGSYESVVSEIGLERIKQMLRACEKYNLNLCVENLFSAVEIPYIFSHIKHPLLKICYDCGHNNVFTHGFEICKEYGKYITVLHLHENDGSADQHKTLSVGSHVFEKLKNDLQYIDSSVVLASEARVPADNWQDYLRQDQNSLSKLSKLIGK